MIKILLLLFTVNFTTNEVLHDDIQVGYIEQVTHEVYYYYTIDSVDTNIIFLESVFQDTILEYKIYSDYTFIGKAIALDDDLFKIVINNNIE